MNLQKLKVYGSCLFIALVCSFFMTSCTSEESLTLDTQDELLLERGILLPTEIHTKGSAYVNAHMTDLSESLEVTYSNNYTVGQYLVELGIAEAIINSLPSSANLSEVDLSPYLTQDQTTTIESRMIDALPQIQKRGCTPVYEWNNCCWRNQWNQCVGCWKHVSNYPLGC